KYCRDSLSSKQSTSLSLSSVIVAFLLVRVVTPCILRSHISSGKYKKSSSKF
ncbi:unnamed protein product, partial [Brassica rapa subsp. narinosa]